MRSPLKRPITNRCIYLASCQEFILQTLMLIDAHIRILLTNIAEISTESKIVMPTVYKCICIVCRGGIFLSKLHANRMWLVNIRYVSSGWRQEAAWLSSLIIMQHWCCTCIKLMSKKCTACTVAACVILSRLAC